MFEIHNPVEIFRYLMHGSTHNEYDPDPLWKIIRDWMLDGNYSLSKESKVMYEKIMHSDKPIYYILGDKRWESIVEDIVMYDFVYFWVEKIKINNLTEKDCQYMFENLWDENILWRVKNKVRHNSGYKQEPLKLLIFWEKVNKTRKNGKVLLIDSSIDLSDLSGMNQIWVNAISFINYSWVGNINVLAWDSWTRNFIMDEYLKVIIHDFYFAQGRKIEINSVLLPREE